MENNVADSFAWNATVFILTHYNNLIITIDLATYSGGFQTANISTAVTHSLSGTMSNQDIHDKAGEPIREGDHVYTKSMGDRHEGDVKKIITSVSEAEKEGVKNPPKVNLAISPTFQCLPGEVIGTNVGMRCCSRIKRATM